MKIIIITGGCGFIGHHFVEHFLKYTDWKIYVVDKLSYASFGLDRIRDVNVFDPQRVQVFTADITRPLAEGLLKEMNGVNYILHLAAESHVDRSIADPLPFVYANVVGTANILQFARQLGDLEAFNYFSTDEVFGPALEVSAYKEWDRYNSTNPYAAAKAGGEELCLAWANTYGLPLFITHTMNCFGERQHPEKFIPMCIKKILIGDPITIHASADKKIPGSRFYIHCRNTAAATHFLLERFEQRQKYNIVGEREVNNLELAENIAAILGKPLNYEMVDFHSSRPGHDLRYGLCGKKMADMGWKVPSTFEESLEKTVKWTIDNPQWL